MKKILLFKLNKIPMFVIFILMVLVGVSFYSYYNEYFSYSKEYYEIKENCTGQDDDSKLCSSFQSKEDLTYYLENFDPVVKYQQLDAITLTCEIVEHTIFSSLQFLSPLLIILIVAGRIHSESSSGMFRNYLLREQYKKYLFQKIKWVMKISLVFPVTLLVIFFISCLVTKFNFQIDSFTKMIAVYDSWKYSNFILYGAIICSIQYFVSFFYGMIGLLVSFKNKNIIVAVIQGYILFLVVDLFLYIFIYSYVINRVLGFHNLTDYFSITGYWFFKGPVHSLLLFGVCTILVIAGCSAVYFLLGKKEKVVIENEKQIA